MCSILGFRINNTQIPTNVDFYISSYSTTELLVLLFWYIWIFFMNFRKTFSNAFSLWLEERPHFCCRWGCGLLVSYRMVVKKFDQPNHYSNPYPQRWSLKCCVKLLSRIQQSISADCRRTCDLSGNLHKLGKVNKRYRNVPYVLRQAQAQRRVDTWRLVLRNPVDERWLKAVVTWDEKWVHYSNTIRKISRWNPDHWQNRLINEIDSWEKPCYAFGVQQIYQEYNGEDMLPKYPSLIKSYNFDQQDILWVILKTSNE